MLAGRIKKFALFLVPALLALTVWQVAASPAPQSRARGGFPPPQTAWGPAESLGNGEIQTFVTLTRSGKPIFVGVRFDAQVLSGLPQEMSDGAWDIIDPDTGDVIWHCCGHETILDFPPEGSATPFKFFIANWNPHGHVPPGVYDTPHFDFHFYTITDAERKQITTPGGPDEMCLVEQPDGSTAPVPLTCDLYERAVAPLPADQQPPNNVNVNAVEPGMGNHLIDLSSPEFTGGAFSHTWIYGAFDGRLIFHEPMITVAFFEQLQDEVCVPIGTPQAMPDAGYYPTEYCMRYLGNQDAYTVTLESFQWFSASDGIVE